MKKRWQDAWMLAKADLLRFKFGTIITIVFNTYLGLCTLVLLSAILEFEHTTSNISISIALDFVLLTLVTNLGYAFTRRAFRYWSEDSYRQYLIKLRTMPVDMRSIIMARCLLMAVYLLINSAVFFGIQYVVLEELRELLSPGLFMIYIFVGMVYSILFHMLYTVLEWGFSGKKYMGLICVAQAIFLTLSILIGMTDNSLFFSVVYLIQNWPWMTFIIALVLLSQILSFGARLLYRTLRRIDLM